MDNIDLVLGAKGSPLQLILSSVYQIDAPPGNISYAEAETWMKNPMVESAVPLAYGDNYSGYKIVGTDENYLKHFGLNVIEGTSFAKDFEVVIGADIALKTGLKIGDTFFGTHGDSEDDEVHDAPLVLQDFGIAFLNTRTNFVKFAVCVLGFSAFT